MASVQYNENIQIKLFEMSLICMFSYCIEARCCYFCFSVGLDAEKPSGV